MQDVLARIRDHDFTKELKWFEFETKFSITTRRNALETLRAIEHCFHEQSRYVLVHITGGDKLVTRVAFFTKGATEYTAFAYRGCRMLKVKRHRILRRGGLPIFKNEERLLIDREDFARKLRRYHHRFRRHQYRLVDLHALLRRLQFDANARIGTMVKTRAKDFVLDQRDGRIYAVAVTFCTSGGRSQKQLEVEYVGYVPGSPRRKMQDEREILRRTVELSQLIRRRSPVTLRSSTERKFDFVTRHRR